MKQTAIEWFIEKTIESGHLWVTDTPSDMTELGKLIEQAKQMEKEQIMDAYWDGGQDIPLTTKTCEQYYNKTYNNEK
jgi:hypothetical protein